MYEFNIELPKEVLTSEKHDSINFDALEGKIIIGLMGYAKSGKDFITKTFIEDYGYTRVAFADNIKKEMNQYLKEAVRIDLNARELKEYEELKSQGVYTNNIPWKIEQIDFFTEDLYLKKRLRPYIIWYGEKLRTINGKFCWINKALMEDGKGIEKIILSDVRRVAELDVFKNSNEFKKRRTNSMLEAGYISNDSKTDFFSDNFDTSVNNYGTLLLEVNQLGLTDTDKLTIETIQTARENWMIDDTFYVDSRIPGEKNYREKAIATQIKRITNKFGVTKPDKSKNIQTTIFQDNQ